MTRQEFVQRLRDRALALRPYLTVRRIGATVAVGMNVSNLGKHAPTRYFRKIAPLVDAVPPAA